ncbi:DEKNAAC103515 [Brettanomyces naardenensis]|uniref:Glycine cleavage system H protein n=1 Tax=Brettanomyces naardenensis TaxID=13370 RepID=A0A448YNF8_BRENA|nr:DEKNAAC103515 [Brettanomyces naardenensis]
MSLTRVSGQLFRHAAKPMTRALMPTFQATLFSARFNSTSANKLNPESIVSTYSAGPVTLKFTPEHEWISIHPDGTTFVGITTYAADALGDATYIELPSDLLNEQVTKGDTIGSVESVKSASDIYSPVDGEVSEVNGALEEKPALLNEDPMGEGWIAKIKVEEGFKGDELLSEEEYVKLLEEAEEEEE